MNLASRNVRIPGRRVSLEPICEEFLSDSYFGWLNDAEVMKYSRHSSKEHSIESATQYFLAANRLSWGVFLNNYSSKHIGNITADVCLETQSADIGILIGEKSLWGRGFAKEAMELLIGYLGAEEGLCRVTVGMNPANEPMQNLAKSIGMERIIAREQSQCAKSASRVVRYELEI